MSYSSADGRRQLLDELERAASALSTALGAVGEAYEALDEQAADRLEEELFGPLQRAYGRAQRTHNDFADRHRLSRASFTAAGHVGRPGDARGAIQRAVQELAGADAILSTLQDSMLPVEVGDPELRAGLSATRELITPLPSRARDLLRLLGR